MFVYPQAKRRAVLRASFYGVYLLLGVLHSFTWSLPLSSFESFFAYQKMYEAFSGLSWNGIIDMPYRAVELSIIPLFFASAPFFLLLGPCLAALHLGTLAWNFLGLLLIERSLKDPDEGLLAAALAGLGLSLATHAYLRPNGGHQQILLPFGLLLYLTSRFLRSGAAISRREAFLVAFAAVMIAAFMVALAPYVLIACLVCFATIGARETRRLFPGLLSGLAVGAVLAVPLFLRQHEPAAHLGFAFDFLRQYGVRLAWLIAFDLPSYLAVRGSAIPGYFLETVLLGLLVWSIASGACRHAPLLRIVVLWSLAIPFLMPAYPSYIPQMPIPNFFRLRYFQIVWPAWALLLAMGAVRLWKADLAGFLRKTSARVPAAVAGIWLLSGTLISYAAIDYGHLGVTLRMPLATPLGRILTRHGAPGLMKVDFYPQDLRETGAMFAPLCILVWAPDHPLQFFLEGLPPDLREPFVFGAGLVRCEGSIPLAEATESKFSSLVAALSAQERETLERGCEIGKRWRSGEIAFRALAWPIESKIIETHPHRALEAWEYFEIPRLDVRQQRWLKGED